MSECVLEVRLLFLFGDSLYQSISKYQSILFQIYILLIVIQINHKNSGNDSTIFDANIFNQSIARVTKIGDKPFFRYYLSCVGSGSETIARESAVKPLLRLKSYLKRETIVRNGLKSTQIA